MKKIGKNEEGIALIAAVLAIAVLLAIGLSFSFNMRLEQKAAANMYSVKARYLAEAGIARAVADLRNDFETGTYQKRNFDTLADNWKTADWVTKVQTGIGPGGYQIFPVYQATTAYQASTIYVVDEASKIYINDANPNLATLLDGLFPGKGTAIVTYRNSLGGQKFITTEEIQKVSGLGNYNDFKDYITANAYVDTSPGVNRAPINVNTAGQYVLQAVIGGVPGITVPQRDKVVLAILEYRSGKQYDITKDPWMQTGTAVGAGNSNPFDGLDTNRPDGIDPIIKEFTSVVPGGTNDGLDNNGDGTPDNASDAYMFAGGARGEFEELIYSLVGGVSVGYGSNQFSATISGTLADEICANANPDPNAVYGLYTGANSWTTEFSFKSRNFEITSMGRVLADPSDWNSEKYAESKIKVIIQRSQ